MCIGRFRPIFIKKSGPTTPRKFSSQTELNFLVRLQFRSLVLKEEERVAAGFTACDVLSEGESE